MTTVGAARSLRQLSSVYPCRCGPVEIPPTSELVERSLSLEVEAPIPGCPASNDIRSVVGMRNLRAPRAPRLPQSSPQALLPSTKLPIVVSCTERFNNHGAQPAASPCYHADVVDMESSQYELQENCYVHREAGVVDFSCKKSRLENNFAIPSSIKATSLVDRRHRALAYLFAPPRSCYPLTRTRSTLHARHA
jgi:hypothetical protein